MRKRVTFIDNQKLLSGVTANSYIVNKQLEKIIPKTNLISQNTFYQHMYSIDRVINFCKITKAKLLIVGLLISDSCLRHLANTPSFYPYPYTPNCDHPINLAKFVDLGTDQSHPGPEQHVLYKNFILSLI